VNNQQRICAMAELENKHKELVDDFKVLRTEFSTVQATLAALIDQNKKGVDYVEFLKQRVADRIASGNVKK